MAQCFYCKVELEKFEGIMPIDVDGERREYEGFECPSCGNLRLYRKGKFGND